MTVFDIDGQIVREPKPPKRNAMIGERVLFYPTGSDSEPPLLAIVTDANKQLVRLSVVGVGRLKFQIVDWRRHMDDPYWDSVPSRAKHNNGAWDFHPVEGPYFDKYVNMAKARAHRGSETEDIVEASA
jgi:hypothetical protein